MKAYQGGILSYITITIFWLEKEARDATISGAINYIMELETLASMILLFIFFNHAPSGTMLTFGLLLPSF